MFSIAMQKQDGTSESFGLAFHKKDELREDVGQRGIGRDHFKNPALPSPKELLLFDLRDVAANDDTA
jgi:hypothetical protein